MTVAEMSRAQLESEVERLAEEIGRLTNNDLGDALVQIAALETDLDALHGACQEARDGLERVRNILQRSGHAFLSCTPLYPMNPFECGACAAMKETRERD